MKTNLQVQRERAGMSKSALARKAEMNPASITWAEQRGFALYPVQLAKLALALGWEREAATLLEEVTENA